MATSKNVKQWSYSRLRHFLNWRGEFEPSDEAIKNYIEYCLKDFKPTEACALGQAIHCELQGIEFNEKVFTANSLGFDNFRSKEAREKRDELVNNEFVQVSDAFFEKVKTISDEAKNTECVKSLLEKADFKAELHASGKIDGVNFHGYVDLYTEQPTSKLSIVDIKTVAQFDKQFKHIEDYITQVALYAKLTDCNPFECGIILVETVDPFRVAIIDFDGADFDKAIKELVKCAKFAETIEVNEDELEIIKQKIADNEEERKEKMKKELASGILNYGGVAWMN